MYSGGGGGNGKKLIPHDSEFLEETGCGGQYVHPPLLAIPNTNYRPGEKQEKVGILKGNSNIFFFFFPSNPATHLH